MSYPYEKLFKQKAHKFHFVWLAGTAGMKDIKNEESDNIDVVALGDEINNWIATEFPDAANRLAIKLAATLIRGLTLIHNAQTDRLLEQCELLAMGDMDKNVDVPSETISSPDDLTPVVLVRKPRKPRKPRTRKFIIPPFRTFEPVEADKEPILLPDTFLKDRIGDRVVHLPQVEEALRKLGPMVNGLPVVPEPPPEEVHAAAAEVHVVAADVHAVDPDVFLEVPVVRVEPPPRGRRELFPEEDLDRIDVMPAEEDAAQAAPPPPLSVVVEPAGAQALDDGDAMPPPAAPIEPFAGQLQPPVRKRRAKKILGQESLRAVPDNKPRRINRLVYKEVTFYTPAPLTITSQGSTEMDFANIARILFDAATMAAKTVDKREKGLSSAAISVGQLEGLVHPYILAPSPAAQQLQISVQPPEGPSHLGEDSEMPILEPASHTASLSNSAKLLLEKLKRFDTNVPIKLADLCDKPVTKMDLLIVFRALLEMYACTDIIDFVTKSDHYLDYIIKK